MRQRLIDGEVAQVEEEIAHRGVFPVEYPDVLPIVQEVAGQQIIVARPGFLERTNGLLNLLHQGKNQWERLREGDTMLSSEPVIVSHCRKGRETAWEGRAAMVAFDRLDNACEHIGLRSIFRRDTRACDEARDQHIFRC